MLFKIALKNGKEKGGKENEPQESRRLVNCDANVYCIPESPLLLDCFDVTYPSFSNDRTQVMFL